MMMAELVGTSNRFVDVVGPMNVSLLAGVAAKATSSAIEQMNFMRQTLSPAPPLSTATPFRGPLYCFVRTTSQSHPGAKAEGKMQNEEWVGKASLGEFELRDEERGPELRG